MIQKEINHDRLGTDLVFSGLQGMIDPPRPEAAEAIRGCKAAGIRVVMITGDHAVTASAIGRMLGIRRNQAPPLRKGTGGDKRRGTLQPRAADLCLCPGIPTAQAPDRPAVHETR